MAEAHHDDHGNTPAAWFLTLSWIVVWSVSGAAIIFFGQGLLLWTVLGLGASVVCAIIAGAMKKAGMGRKQPRQAPMTRAQWEALQAKRGGSAERDEAAETESNESVAVGAE
ncbi:HGxxPAAW family protein [Salinactinospora qingdaonensis]|uniref:Uncharacterized protein n=1 Tax=Salinactinospora qingdaonensis TaxID=702744 RepID=A0ABP7FMB7_9ACTN